MSEEPWEEKTALFVIPSVDDSSSSLFPLHSTATQRIRQYVHQGGTIFACGMGAVKYACHSASQQYDHTGLNLLPQLSWKDVTLHPRVSVMAFKTASLLLDDSEIRSYLTFSCDESRGSINYADVMDVVASYYTEQSTQCPAIVQIKAQLGKGVLSAINLFDATNKVRTHCASPNLRATDIRLS